MKTLLVFERILLEIYIGIYLKRKQMRPNYHFELSAVFEKKLNLQQQDSIVLLISWGLFLFYFFIAKQGRKGLVNIINKGPNLQTQLITFIGLTPVDHEIDWFFWL